jgi:hypothetical protein
LRAAVNLLQLVIIIIAAAAAAAAAERIDLFLKVNLRSRRQFALSAHHTERNKRKAASVSP